MSELRFRPPGINFGLPMDEYLADPSLSSSGIRNLLISPLDYWVNSPLNPDYQPEETDATELGSAFHKRILEGKAAFDAAYAPKLDRSDYPEALKSGDELKAKCEDLGLPKSGVLPELRERIRRVEPDVRFWTDIEEKYLAQHEGKEFLKPEVMRQIELAAHQIETSPQTSELLRGGHPEVSIFWVDEETGVRMKARLDYLAPGLIVELKTFSNSRGKPLLSAVAAAMAEHGYGIQAHVQMDAFRAARSLPVNSKSFPPGVLLGREADLRFIFLFQETGRVPNVVVREFASNGIMGLNAYYQTTLMQYRDALGLYQECLQRFGTSPWAEPAVIEVFDDTDFPAWMFN